MKIGRQQDDLGGRVPPNQRLTRGWPVLHASPVPKFNPAIWSFRVWGEVENEFELTWDEFRALPPSRLERLPLRHRMVEARQHVGRDLVPRRSPIAREAEADRHARLDPRRVRLHGEPSDRGGDRRRRAVRVVARRRAARARARRSAPPRRPEAVRVEEREMGARRSSSWIATSAATGRSAATTTSADPFREERYCWQEWQRDQTNGYARGARHVRWSPTRRRCERVLAAITTLPSRRCAARRARARDRRADRRRARRAGLRQQRDGRLRDPCRPIRPAPRRRARGPSAGRGSSGRDRAAQIGRAGYASKIMTGAPVPPGADAVVPWEDTEPRDGATVAVLAGSRRASTCVRAARTCKAGDEVIAAGTVLAAGAPRRDRVGRSRPRSSRSAAARRGAVDRRRARRGRRRA